MRFDIERRVAVFAFMAVMTSIASIADASGGACARKRMPPNQNLFWVCVTPGAACAKGSCQTVSYGGIVPYSTCECLTPVSDPNDFSYGTGGYWNLPVASGAPAPGGSATFQLADGINALIVYPNVDVDRNDGTIQNAQEYSNNGDLTGSFTLDFGPGAPADSIAVHATSLSMTMVSWMYEGQPTGTTTLTLAPDGGAATGIWHAPSGTLKFDEPIHCLASNSLLGDFDFYFRPILIEGSDAKAGDGVNPFSLFFTGYLLPAQSVATEQRPWSRFKTLYR
jgi:hypothetical protein